MHNNNLFDFPGTMCGTATPSDDRLQAIASQIHDWQINHGSLLKVQQPNSREREQRQGVLCRPVGVSAVPTVFPRAQFEHALQLQTTYNELYAAIATDEPWLAQTIQEVVDEEPLAAALWRVHEEVRQRGGYGQEISAGIFRSDYMLAEEEADADADDDDDDDDGDGVQLQLKQVEFNTFSCAGGAHANKVADLHHFLARKGSYQQHDGVNSDCGKGGIGGDVSAHLPRNTNIAALAACLCRAHCAYGEGTTTTTTAVLFVVQPYNYNIADERPIEYALWNSEPAVPAYRVEFGDVLQRTVLTDNGALLFQPSSSSSSSSSSSMVEVSTVYMRAGYEAHEYASGSNGVEARIRLEQSRAIKCPSLLSHITTFKKVQQALTAPGAVERFLQRPAQAQSIRETFVSMSSPPHPEHQHRHPLWLGLSTDYVLKPSLEGGGHNVYGAAIPGFLASLPETRWSSYVLMERIRSPVVHGVLMMPDGAAAAGDVVSELGVLGSCLWRPGCMLENSLAGWSFKTKHAHVDEMSVVKGYGCFDTPCLIP